MHSGMQMGTKSSPDGEVLEKHKQANKELLEGPTIDVALLTTWWTAGMPVVTSSAWYKGLLGRHTRASKS